jgi:hypothetical protein
MIGFIGQLHLVTTSNDCILSVVHTSIITIGHTRSSPCVTVSTNRCLVAAFNSGRSLSSGIPNYPPPHLTKSQGNSTQYLYLSSPHSLTSSLHSTDSKTCPTYNISARAAQKTQFLCCSVVAFMALSFPRDRYSDNA